MKKICYDINLDKNYIKLWSAEIDIETKKDHIQKFLKKEKNKMMNDDKKKKIYRITTVLPYVNIYCGDGLIVEKVRIKEDKEIAAI